MIRLDGSPERDFLHVDDAVSAYLAIEGALDRGGPGRGIQRRRRAPHSVRELVDLIAAAAGTGIEPEYLGTGTPDGEIDRQYVDSTKLRELTGWRPRVELADGLSARSTGTEHPEARPAETVALRRSSHVRTIHGHGQGHEKDRRRVPGRAGEGAGAELGRRRAAASKERVKKVESALGRFNVAPTQEVLTVRSSPDPDEAAQGEREARLMRWGLVPRWAKDLKVGYRMINAKAENLSSSRAYSPLVGKFRHRCLIVADGFYEWMKAEDPKQPRQPWRFTVDGGEPFAFAGLCTRKEWEDPEDRGFDDGWLYSCTIVTTTPNELVAKVHDRMPAILPRPRPKPPGCGPTSSWRRRWRCARAGGLADGERPGQPEAEQGRQRQRGSAQLLVARRPAERQPSSSSSSSVRSWFSSSASSSIGGGTFFSSPVRTVVLPALVVSVQATLAPGTEVVRQTVSKGSTRSCFGLPSGRNIRGARCQVRTLAIRA